MLTRGERRSAFARLERTFASIALGIAPGLKEAVRMNQEVVVVVMIAFVAGYMAGPLDGIFYLSMSVNGSFLFRTGFQEPEVEAMERFILTPFAVTSLSVLCGYMDVVSVSWRWSFWLQMTVAVTSVLLNFVMLPKTYV
ncbi:hypothetical protein B0H21DRAFT_881931 [Amylocystis lapponica]|nr:hypothetical protein B0H21DRAFT_881931 [Amylocystis lapponica]